ncbi:MULTISPECIES: MFS transporter [unclassified Variovorax]|uniref:MFS transporter n=1 Tax=unclassified Variovorax TaxID=663243 RepID=UPI0025790DFA|nr:MULTISPECIES: MFS transporter [unclassified Variovorax]MDM0086827.1 MFS transporter [Variovorax sp. J22G40]MDM0144917.1 MFS transporter [Variovorax sp. J2P1-31]
MLLLRNASLRLLFFGQALYWSCSIIGITLTSLVGARLAPWPVLATLPLALLVLGNLAAVRPLSMFMQRHGRRRGLMRGAAFGIAGGGVAAAGVVLGSFAVFCAGIACIGVYQASAGYYRYAALEAVDASQKGRAAACVVGGGIGAALLAPSIALWSRDALATPFAGAYLAIAALAAIGLLVMSRLREGAVPQPAGGGWSTLPALLRRPALRAAVCMTAIGHGLMVLAMNATPLAMEICGLSLASAAQVIQWHVIGMFLPAFFAGGLVDRWGSRRVAALGAACIALSACVALGGSTFAPFFASSFLLGVGWNLMIIAGTTLLGESHAPQERGQAQALMELTNSSTATLMSFASGALLNGLGWPAINLAMLPLLAVAAGLLWTGRGQPKAAA